jgi:uncharacterized protein (TIGR00730 family)
VNDLPRPPSSDETPALDGSGPSPRVAAAIRELLATLPEGTPHQDMLAELVQRILSFPGRGIDRGELKLVSHALRDFRKGFQAFAPHRGRKKVAIFGSARSPVDSPIYAHCKRFAAEAVKRDYMVITGAGPGIMQAGNEGAGREHSFGVSIALPFEASANPAIDGDPKLVEFKYFFTRKLSFVKESAAIVLFPGGVGTLDEGYEALTLLQTGKSEPVPVILMDLPGGSYWPAWEKYQRENLLGRGLISGYDRNLYRITTDIDKALDVIDLFYRCYHSLRYVAGDYTVLRLKHTPTPELLALLNERYRDLLAAGDFELMDGPHPEEADEPEAVRKLPRIGFHFVRRRLGRLRRMIDEINLADHAEEPEPPSHAHPPSGMGTWDLPAPEEDD